MNPEEITLSSLTKSFEYTKIANDIDQCDCVDTLKVMAKSFCKLYYKQQETLSMLGTAPDING